MSRESVLVNATPTQPAARLKSLDAIRGFALFGVLLVNMYNFGAYSLEWSGAVDRAFSVSMHAFFETKSLRLLSLLFGVGLAIQLGKTHLSERQSLWFYARRLLVLFIFGMGHALFFDGDILMEYAILGMILLAFRNTSGPLLLVLAFVLLAAFPAGNLLYQDSEAELATHWEDELTLAELREGHPYLGSPLEVFRENSHAIPPPIGADLSGPESSPVVFAMLLLGLYLGRKIQGLDLTAARPKTRWFCAWCIGIGAASAIAEWYLTREYGYAVYEASRASPAVGFLGDMLFNYGSTALALGYAAGILLLADFPVWKPALGTLANLGRMALTAYLCSTLLFTTLFYGWGFGQMFLLGPAATTLYALLFFALLLCFCNWWLKRFRFGPAEWLWRSLTYLKLQPMRR